MNEKTKANEKARELAQIKKIIHTKVDKTKNRKGKKKKHTKM